MFYSYLANKVIDLLIKRSAEDICTVLKSIQIALDKTQSKDCKQNSRCRRNLEKFRKWFAVPGTGSCSTLQQKIR